MVCSAATANSAPMIIASTPSVHRPRGGVVSSCGGERVVRIDRLSDDLIEQIHAGIRRVSGRLHRTAGVGALAV